MTIMINMANKMKSHLLLNTQMIKVSLESTNTGFHTINKIRGNNCIIE